MQSLKDTLERRATRGVELGDEAVFDAALSAVDRPHRSARSGRLLLTCAATVLVVGGAVAVWQVTRWEPGESVTSVSPVQVVTPEPGTWAPFPAPPLSPRFQYVSVTTPQGWLVWGGNSYDEGGGSHSLSDGAYFDFATATWRVLPDAPLDSHRGDAIGVWTGNEVAVMNGIDGVRAAAFDPVSFTWRELPSPPGMSAVYNAVTRLYAFERTLVLVQSDDVNHVIRRFDLDTGTWAHGADIDIAGRAQVYVATSDTDVYLLPFGVEDPPAACLDAGVRRYDVERDIWSLVSTQPIQSGWSPGVFAWIGDRLLLAGGWECESAVKSKTAMALDPTSGEWQRLADSPAGLWDGGMYDNVILTSTTAIVVQQDGRPVVYDHKSDSWEVGPSFLPDGDRYQFTPTAWFAGQVHIWSPGLLYDVSSTGYACCRPLDGAWVYLPPSPTASP